MYLFNKETEKAGNFSAWPSAAVWGNQLRYCITSHVWNVRFTIARSEFLTHILRDLLRNEKFAKGNLFEADFRQEEVTDM